VCIALCTTVAHNIAQNRPDNFPPYPPMLKYLHWQKTKTVNRNKTHVVNLRQACALHRSVSQQRSLQEII